MYQTGAAFDQSVLSGPMHDLGVYTDDSRRRDARRLGQTAVQLSIAATSRSRATSISQNRWVDKTGNGDGDYLDYTPALAFGQELLAQYSPANYPNAAGVPEGHVRRNQCQRTAERLRSER